MSSRRMKYDYDLQQLTGLFSFQREPSGNLSISTMCGRKPSDMTCLSRLTELSAFLIRMQKQLTPWTSWQINSWTKWMELRIRLPPSFSALSTTLLILITRIGYLLIRIHLHNQNNRDKSVLDYACVFCLNSKISFFSARIIYLCWSTIKVSH